MTNGWFARQRMEWITETLRVFGFIGRPHLQRKFGISLPQASLDLTAFQRRYPGVLRYDSSLKRYVAVRWASESPSSPRQKE